MILCLETATSWCSVALCNSTGIIALKESNESKSHATMLTIYIEDILRECGLKASDLEGIAVSKGPGSYTGLRIGVSVAKGIAYAASLPLIGIETTLSMYNGIRSEGRRINEYKPSTIFCPMLDARRMEVYYSLYNMAGEKIKEISAEIISADTFSAIPESSMIICFGDGALKCKDIIKRQNILFIENYRISAADMLEAANEAFTNQNFENVAYFEPLYLKDFITTKSKKNILEK